MVVKSLYKLTRSQPNSRMLKLYLFFIFPRGIASACESKHGMSLALNKTKSELYELISCNCCTSAQKKWSRERNLILMHLRFSVPNYFPTASASDFTENCTYNRVLWRFQKFFAIFFSRNQ